MNAAIYVRVSTKDKGQTTDNQEYSIREYCKNNNIQIVKTYSDIISGSKSVTKRTGMLQMFEDCKLKIFDTVIFWSIDRITREGTEQLFTYFQELAKHKINWISLNEEYLNNIPEDFKPVIISLLAQIAKCERKKISDRTKAGLQRTKAKGTILGASKKIDIEEVKILKDKNISNRQISKLLQVSSTAIDKIVRMF